MAVASPPLERDLRVIGVVGLAHGGSHFFHLVLPPLFPLLKTTFGVTYTELGVLMSVFFAASGLCQTPAGFLVDRIGAALAAFGAGVIRDTFGAYTWAWWGGAMLCVIASVLSFAVRRQPVLEPESERVAVG